MKKQRLALLLILCFTTAFGSLYASADSADDNILTLEEAKAEALENDVQFKLQQSYIQQASENYDDVYASNTKTDNNNYNSIAKRAAAEISRKIAIENAASSVRKAVFSRNDLKRASDFNVTEAYYGAIKAKYALLDKEAAVKLKKTALETAKAKYGMGLITKSALSEADTAHTSAVTAYNTAFSELQNSITKLGKSIGRNLDVFSTQLDMTLSIPDIAKLDLNKIKEDYMKNNSGFYSAKEQYDIAEYKLQLTEEKYDYYYKRLPDRTTAIMDELNDMLNEAKRDFEDAKYSYSEKEKELNVTLNNQYTSINSQYESYLNSVGAYEDFKLTIQSNNIKYRMGLISKTSLESSEAGLKEKENQLQTSLVNLILQYNTMTQYNLE